jgi:serine phosphatase RsbU (regulator of sigma subunit)
LGKHSTGRQNHNAGENIMILNKSFKDQKISYFSLLYLTITLLVMPSLGLYFGLRYFDYNRKSFTEKKIKRQLSGIKTDLTLFCDQEKFWINHFKFLFAKTNSAKRFVEEINQFSQETHTSLSVWIYNVSGQFLKSNQTQTEKWKNIGPHLLPIFLLPDSRERYATFDKLRPVFGPDFFTRTPGGRSYLDDFAISDFYNDKFRYWLAMNESLLTVIRIPTDALKRLAGLEYYFNFQLNKTIHFALFESEKLLSCNSDRQKAIKAFNRLGMNSHKEFIKIKDNLYSLLRIEEEKWLLLGITIPAHNMHPGKLALLTPMLLLLLLFMFYRTGYISSRLEDLSLFQQLFLLLSISVGIPLLILLFVATSYFAGKESALIHENHSRMIEYVQEIDENLKTELAQIARSVDKMILDNQNLIVNNFTAPYIYELGKLYLGNYLANIIITYNGEVLELNRKSSSSVINQSSLEKEKSEQKTLELIANYHLSYLNGTKPRTVSAKTAYMVEMFFQKPVEMFINELVTMEGVAYLAGWGNSKLILLVKSYPMLSKNIYDLHLIYSMVYDAFQKHFIKKNIHNLSRNPHNYKVYASYKKTVLNTNKPLIEHPKLSKLFNKTVDFAMSDPEILDFEGKKHIFVGLKGTNLSMIDFCVLFPIKQIKESLRKEATDLFYLGALALTLVTFMVLILYLNLIVPVRRLQLAAEALKKSDASFRLPEIGNDEFTEMSKIFNRSIEDFEELKIAGIVQSKLMPTNVLIGEDFNIYGRSLPVASLGGDYLDYFEVEAGKTAMLIGDVAGHGVGASLLMAMTKAGIICAHDLQQNPAKILHKLHNIILSIKSVSQRKVMTFQYLLINSDTGESVYANAGGCSPVIINGKTGEIKIINHPGPVLGGFKRSQFTNLNLKIEPGHAIIFYTDGMIESRNSSGQELGYQGLYNIFSRAFSKDAKAYSDKIFSLYTEWIGDAVPDDDQTILIMSRN